RYARLRGDRNALVDLAELLECQAQREVVAAHAAVLLGERQPEQPHVGHPRHHFVRERMLLVVFGRNGRHHASGEVTHRLRELFVVIRQRSGSQKIAHDCSSFASAELPAPPAAVILASGWPTLTWSPAATSSSTTPSTGAASACSIFIASTLTTT